MTLNCILVDDDPNFLSLLARLAELNDDLKLIKSCSNTKQLSKALETENIDLIILDIDMPGQSGIDWLKSSHNIPQVIFVTSLLHHAPEAFDYDVTDYIIKPFNRARFFRAIDRAVSVASHQKWKNQDGNLVIKSSNDYKKIPVQDIYSVHSLGDYIEIYTDDEKHIVLSTLNAIQEKLLGYNFMRIHRQYIVHLSAVRKVSGHEVLLTNGQEVRVSRNLRAELLERVSAPIG